MEPSHARCPEKTKARATSSGHPVDMTMKQSHARRPSGRRDNEKVKQPELPIEMRPDRRGHDNETRGHDNEMSHTSLRSRGRDN